LAKTDVFPDFILALFERRCINFDILQSNKLKSNTLQVTVMAWPSDEEQRWDAEDVLAGWQARYRRDRQVDSLALGGAIAPPPLCISISLF
jgi:hypothetical protein